MALKTSRHQRLYNMMECKAKNKEYEVEMNIYEGEVRKLKNWGFEVEPIRRDPLNHEILFSRISWKSPWAGKSMSDEMLLYCCGMSSKPPKTTNMAERLFLVTYNARWN